MRQENPLQTHEIRVLRLDKKAIFDLLWEIFNEISYEKFQLSHGVNSNICINWCFDERQCEIILFAHNKAERINEEKVIAYMSNLPGEALESLLINIRGKYYQSIKDNAFLIDYPNSVRKKECNSGHRKVLGTLSILWERHVRPLKKHELRVIRLSEQAIHELIWEYFMRNGDEIMDIPEEDSLKKIFCMYAEDKLQELKLYVLNLNEVSMVNFEKMNEYCMQNICFTTKLLCRGIANRRQYTSVMLPKSCVFCETLD